MRSEAISALVMTTLFITAVLAGVFTPSTYKSKFIKSVKNSLTPVNESVKEFMGGEEVGYAIASIYLLILYNNLKVAAINLLLGFTLIAPIAIILFNGYMVGAFLSYGDLITNSILLMPHGVVELAAIIYSSVLGLSLGLEIVRKLRGNEINLMKELKRKADRFKWVITLLAVAAFIEVFITPLLYLAYAVMAGNSINATIPYP